MRFLCVNRAEGGTDAHSAEGVRRRAEELKRNAELAAAAESEQGRSSNAGEVNEEGDERDEM